MVNKTTISREESKLYETSQIQKSRDDNLDGMYETSPQKSRYSHRGMMARPSANEMGRGIVGLLWCESIRIRIMVNTKTII
jgi:hypothetical protein